MACCLPAEALCCWADFLTPLARLDNQDVTHPWASGRTCGAFKRRCSGLVSSAVLFSVLLGLGMWASYLLIPKLGHGIGNRKSG